MLGLGNQTFRGTAPLGESIYGDTDGTLTTGRSGSDRIEVAFSGAFAAIGDAETLAGTARGGADILDVEGSDDLAARALAIGDALEMLGGARGGNDTLVGDENVRVFGDAVTMSGHSRGGDDRIVSTVYLIDQTPSDESSSGNADLMTGYARGGDDHITSDPVPRGWGW